MDCQSRPSTRKIFLLSFLLIFCVTQITYLPASYAFSPSLTPRDNAAPAFSQEDWQAVPTYEPHRTLFLDRERHSFAVFSDLPHLIVPSLLGKVEQVEGETYFIPTLQIDTTDNHYVFTQPDEPDFLKIVERLPEGGMGRLLRYQSLDENGRWLDLEFVYDDRGNELTILDHAAGRFYRATFKGEPVDPQSVSPRPRQERFTDEFKAAPISSPKFLGPNSWDLSFAFPKIQRVHSQCDLYNELIVWLNRLVRGPPVGGLAL